MVPLYPPFRSSPFVCSCFLLSPLFSSSPPRFFSPLTLSSASFGHWYESILLLNCIIFMYVCSCVLCCVCLCVIFSQRLRSELADVQPTKLCRRLQSRSSFLVGVPVSNPVATFSCLIPAAEMAKMLQVITGRQLCRLSIWWARAHHRQ